MAEGKKLGGAGLRGQVAGKTALSTVGKSGSGLTYRGYDVKDLAENCEFEEVAHLILKGELPTQDQLATYKAKLKSLRGLPDALKTVLEQIPKDAHPMDVMRTGCSMLGNLETETDFSQQEDATDRLLAAFPSIICYWYRFSHDGVKIDPETDDESIGAHFLHLLRGEKPNELHERVMNVSLILYAEHEFNASTFTARVCASTLSDLHSCVTGAIGSLRGPLHGGANQKVIEMLERIEETEGSAEKFVARAKDKNDQTRLMGFGHRVYKNHDPRATILRKTAIEVLGTLGVQSRLLEIGMELEEMVMKDPYFIERKLYPNVDFYSGIIYKAIGIPVPMFTVLFAMGRLPGWIAQWVEMHHQEDFRIGRPRQVYTGPTQRPYVPISDR